MPSTDKKLQKGQSFGGWTLIGERPLGKGGNSEVWKVTDEGGRICAIKFLFKHFLENVAQVNLRKVARFRAELEFLRSNSHRKGILHIVDSFFPEIPTSSARPWIVTEFAARLDEAYPAHNRRFATIVERVAEIAETLSELHTDRIFHRDIKPANLFVSERGAVIGDFGLVEFPSKEAITGEGEIVGPMFFIAPELLERRIAGSDGSADVYSLARTLWSLATGQNYPPPGELRRDVPQLRVSSYVNDSRAPLLDEFLEKATRHDPVQRVTAGEMALELRAWLNTASPQRPGLPDISLLKAKFQPIVSGHIKSAASLEARSNQVDELATLLMQGLKPLFECVKDCTALTPKLSEDNFVTTALSPIHGLRGALRGRSACIFLECPRTKPGRPFAFLCGFGLEFHGDGVLAIGAGHFYGILETLDRLNRAWVSETSVPIDSLRLTAELARLQTELEAQLPAALERFLDLIREDR